MPVCIVCCEMPWQEKVSECKEGIARIAHVLMDEISRISVLLEVTFFRSWPSLPARVFLVCLDNRPMLQARFE